MAKKTTLAPMFEFDLGDPKPIVRQVKPRLKLYEKRLLLQVYMGNQCWRTVVTIDPITGAIVITTAPTGEKRYVGNLNSVIPVPNCK